MECQYKKNKLKKKHVKENLNENQKTVFATKNFKNKKNTKIVSYL